MKHPLRAIIGSILGIAIAGVPLFYFAASQGKTAVHPRVVAECMQVPAELRFTGKPTSIIIRCSGKVLCRVSPVHSNPLYTSLPLPSLHRGAASELEIEAVWSDSCCADCVLSVELMPPGLPARSDTQWAHPKDHTLHAVFLYRW